MRKQMALLASLALAAAQVGPAQAQDAGEDGVQSRAFVRFAFGPTPHERPLQFGLGLYGGETCAFDEARFSPAGACETRRRGFELRGSGADDFSLWATGPREVNLLALEANRAAANGENQPWVWVLVGAGVVATAAFVVWLTDEDDAENCPEGYVADFLGECQPIEV